MRGGRGFTIVELLIVVVVIAILAAITIVAYNGIQNRAKISQAVSAMRTNVDAIKAYSATNGALPMTVNGVQCFEGTTCWSGADVAGSTALQANLRQVVSGLGAMPTGHAALITNSSTTDSSSGGTYTGWYVLFQVPGSTCPDVGGLRYLNATGGSPRSCRYAVDVV